MINYQDFTYNGNKVTFSEGQSMMINATEMAIALGLLCVIDRCKRGGQKKLIKPRVRVTMDGVNYFINVLSRGRRRVIKA